MGARGRSITGIGRAVNAIDGDRVTIGVGVRDRKIVTIGADGIRTGVVTVVGGVARSVWFTTGEEARRLGGDTFAGCDAARRVALVLNKIYIGRDIDEALEITVGEVLAKVPGDPGENARCARTVIEAVRKAVIDTNVRALAEAVVAVRSLR